ncbi:MAG: hypothetical protein FWC24_01795 [Treponema sp.]|nr:hypothetical protein [Treponema sp.]
MLLLGASSVFSQDELLQRGSIPEELLRPRRDEAPRYPIDTVIGTLGKGHAPTDAYEVARKTAAALLAGNIDVSVLSTVNKVFLESCMEMLNTVSPLAYRLGSGREEPDGSYSFLVRFIGREMGITGELFVRFEERRREAVTEPQPTANESEAVGEEGKEPVERVVVPAQTGKVWLFEDLILEEARSREDENKEDRHRFDFSPYERFF